jgi:hypothetical protein
MRSLLRSEVTDGRVRAALTAGGGLCRCHVRLAADVAEHDSDGMGLAILAGYLVDDAAARVTAARSGARRAWRRRARRDADGGRCPICEAETRRAHGYFEILSGREDLIARLGAGDGLCLPHLALARDLLSEDEAVRLIVRASTRRAAVLHERLRAFVSTFAHGRGASRTSAEDTACADAVDWLAGSRHVGPPS